MGVNQKKAYEIIYFFIIFKTFIFIINQINENIVLFLRIVKNNDCVKCFKI